MRQASPAILGSHLGPIFVLILAKTPGVVVLSILTASITQDDSGENYHIDNVDNADEGFEGVSTLHSKTGTARERYEWPCLNTTTLVIIEWS